MTPISKIVIQELTDADDFDDFDIPVIVNALQNADDMYENGDEPLFTDAKYDAIKLYLTSVDPKNDYLQAIGSDVRGGKVTLPHAMGSLTQAYTEHDFVLWRTKHNIPDDALVVVTDKEDGMSASVMYNNQGELRIGFSRGNGVQGADITRHLRKLKQLPQKVSEPNLELRCELIISKSNFDYLKTRIFRSDGQAYKNPRNMISGLMNSSEAADLSYQFIDAIVYHDWNGDTTSSSKTLQFLDFVKMGFKIPGWHTLRVDQLTDETLSTFVAKRKQESEFELDGVVIELNDPDLRKRINPSKDTLNPEYARKYKISDAANTAMAVVDFVELRISKRGYIIPRVHFHPVAMAGITCTHATGYNMNYILANNIGPGAKVWVRRCGDVVPNIDGFIAPSNNMQLVLDDLEDQGNWHWTVNDKKEQVHAVLDDDHEDVGVKLAVAFFTSIKVEGLKLATCRKLYEAGFNTLDKVINATSDDIGFTIGSYTTGDKIYKSLHERLSDISEPLFVGATGMFGRGVGVRKIKKLYEALGQSMYDLKPGQTIPVEGFDTKTADKFTNGLPVYKEFYALVKDKVKFSVPNAGGHLDGHNIVFTGFRNAALQAKIEKAGGNVSDSVSKNTTLLIALDPEDISTGKSKKADKLGIKIVGLAEAEKYLSL